MSRKYSYFEEEPGDFQLPSVSKTPPNVIISHPSPRPRPEHGFSSSLDFQEKLGIAVRRQKHPDKLRFWLFVLVLLVVAFLLGFLYFDLHNVEGHAIHRVLSPMIVVLSVLFLGILLVISHILWVYWLRHIDLCQRCLGCCNEPDLKVRMVMKRFDSKNVDEYIDIDV